MPKFGHLHQLWLYSFSSLEKCSQKCQFFSNPFLLPLATTYFTLERSWALVLHNKLRIQRHKETMSSSEQGAAIYRPLNDSADEIRYVLLHQGAFMSPIQYDIYHTNLKSHEKSEALSYTGGNRSGALPIYIGSQALNVIKNLHVALQHLRLGNSPRKL
jgi:hypothetical protein